MTFDTVPVEVLDVAVPVRAEPAADPGGETEFAQELSRAIATEADRSEATGGSQDVTIRATEPSLAERAGDRISTLNEARLTQANAEAFEIRPPVRDLTVGMAEQGGATAEVGSPTEAGDPFERSMRDLKGAFHHAIEVELVAKTGSSLNSSMNKLMSGQ